MILPAKHLPQDRSLLALGGHILEELEEPRSISELWERVRHGGDGHDHLSSQRFLSFDWFVLSLSFLYAVSAIEFIRGSLVARRK